jgi:YfiH family protein
MSELDLIMPDWPAPANVRAVATTRAGGVSEGDFASLNLGAHVHDDPAAVATNRERLVNMLGIAREPAWLDQVHGAEVVHADSVTKPVAADAAWTRTPGVACVVMTADCLPVVLADRAGKQVAVAHAGWRGIHAGVLQATVATFTDAGIAPENIVAWLGPAISQANYEVDEALRDEFFLRDPECDYLFKPARPGHWQLDLYRLASRILSGRGVNAVSGGGFCTYADERFFSYRRSGRCGRQATLIWLTS